MPNLFTKRIAYKPFEYPEYDLEGWLPGYYKRRFSNI